MNMNVVIPRPSITTWTDIKLSAFERDVSTYTGKVLMLCSADSMIYQADQYRVLARRFRNAASFLDERAEAMEARHERA